MKETGYKQGWRNTYSEEGQSPNGAVEPIIIIIIIILIIIIIIIVSVIETAEP